VAVDLNRETLQRVKQEIKAENQCCLALKADLNQKEEDAQ
jgi:hypothetical protein